MHCVAYTSRYYVFSYVLGEAGKLTARLYTRSSSLAHASPRKKENIFFFFQICRAIIYINGVLVSDIKCVYVYVPSTFNKLLTEHGFANIASVRRHSRMAVLVDKFFPLLLSLLCGWDYISSHSQCLHSLIFGGERNRPSFRRLI